MLKKCRGSNINSANISTLSTITTHVSNGSIGFIERIERQLSSATLWSPHYFNFE